MNKTAGDFLINSLTNDPEKFYNEGKSYELLQEYFKGFSKDTLRILLISKDKWIKRVAIWITSELGVEGRYLLDVVLEQINDNDEYTCSYALEIIANCANNEYMDAFVNVFFFLEHSNHKIRIAVMNIISNLSTQRIHEAYIFMTKMKIRNVFHEQGLSSLFNANVLALSEITQMVEAEESLARKYGIIVARKLYNKYPQVINTAISSQDIDIQKFSEQVIETERAFNRFMDKDMNN